MGAYIVVCLERYVETPLLVEGPGLVLLLLLEWEIEWLLSLFMILCNFSNRGWCVVVMAI